MRWRGYEWTLYCRGDVSFFRLPMLSTSIGAAKEDLVSSSVALSRQTGKLGRSPHPRLAEPPRTILTRNRCFGSALRQRAAHSPPREGPRRSCSLRARQLVRAKRHVMYL